MSGSFKSSLISCLSLLAGMAAVAAIWSMVPKEDTTTAQNKVRFSQLSGKEQADLRNKAKPFVDSMNKSELARLQQIHSAVESDPQLLPRLKSLDGLLANLDDDTKAKLNPDGEFASDWEKQVQTLARDEHAGDVTYEFPMQVLVHLYARGPEMIVQGHKYEAVLDQAAAEDWGSNEEYQEFINGADRTTRRMFKTLALVERAVHDDTGEFNESILAMAKASLVPEGALRDERGRPPEGSTDEDEDEDKERDAEREKARSQLKTVSTKLQAVKFLEYGLKNTGREFLSRIARETVSPQLFTESFKRSEQIKLMKMTPADATQELSARLVKESNAQNPEFARIDEVLAEAMSQISERTKVLWSEYWNIRRRSFYGGSWRGRDGRGRDDNGRGGEGRGSRRPEDRSSDDRGPGERIQGDRGPGGRGQGGRGNGGPRFGDDKGPEGPARRGPENPLGERSEDRYDFDPQRPSTDRPTFRL